MTQIASKYPIYSCSLTELIDKDDGAVAATQYSKSVSVTLNSTEYISGEILSFALYSSEVGTGDVLLPAGYIYIFDTDPAIASGDAALAAAGAEHKTLLGVITVNAYDWTSDANGGVAYMSYQPIPFKEIKTLYVALKLATGATTINSAAGDDEEFHFRFWYRRES